MSSIALSSYGINIHTVESIYGILKEQVTLQFTFNQLNISSYTCSNGESMKQPISMAHSLQLNLNYVSDAIAT